MKRRFNKMTQLNFSYCLFMLTKPVLKIYVVTSNIYSCSGDLIPRHRKVFNNNHFFRGMVLPSPREREPLEAKYPTASTHTISFLKVTYNLT